MSNQAAEVISFLLENDALRFGDFTLKSGDHSPFFVNLGAIRRAKALTTLAQHLSTRVQSSFPDATLLFGPAYKGIAMATATALVHRVAYGSDLAICFDRKETKGHGELGSFIGQPPEPADRVIIIDDVISNGGTKRQAMAALKSTFGVETAGILVAVNRVRRRDRASLEGLRLEALVDLADLVNFMQQRNVPQAEALRNFYEEGKDD
jgi:orotate phosphoribosyltransferase